MTIDTDDQSYQDALADMMAFVEGTPADSDPAPSPPAAPDPGGWEDDDEADAELYYGSVDEFVREVILPMYRRKVGARGSRRWSAEWWRSAEAVSRLEALWRSWENLRLDGATGMSTWWRDHADYQMNILFDPDGPFGRSEDENKPGAPLPYTPPPPGLFTDARNDR
ncbi:DUF4913 domain-containing protein [Nocardiopsis sp. EMB25]|uniref:DUF4913 domain-containing protein n=1 Tax=Nocardiopsis sp. EMB25 TaxID=2835867 RepID=UPI0022847B3D|nr:DUF4913 domain-containing protein [Nocardiopsis sp. EMB25]MCY9785700.1 DUF4913 domain-containing protein [Nocardiopsis sp. EMB25]